MRQEFGRGLVILPFPGALITFLRQESKDFSFSEGFFFFNPEEESVWVSSSEMY